MRSPALKKNSTGKTFPREYWRLFQEMITNTCAKFGEMSDFQYCTSYLFSSEHYPTENTHSNYVFTEGEDTIGSSSDMSIQLVEFRRVGAMHNPLHYTTEKELLRICVLCDGQSTLRWAHYKTITLQTISLQSLVL